MPRSADAHERARTSAGPSQYVDVAMVGTQPQTARGRRTRERLIAAARVVFERDGYVDSRLVDIVAEAQCSIGSFYTWFEGKDEVFAAVLQEAQQDMLQPAARAPEDADDPVASIEASHRAYFEAYARNARLNQLLNQVAVLDKRFLELRMARADAFIRRNARAIGQWQERGLADRTLDPHLTSMALSGMISRLAGDRHLYQGDIDFEQLVAVATKIWTNALGLTEPQREIDTPPSTTSTSPIT
ncbi:MAG: TetR/AcrR family transcriptional regulator [Mobilicoccus sp.]|nr:TetR/AcrR family transcriptional regulator [Mobilicoccus sp.]